MIECEYCEESFEDESTYLEHLGASHYHDLGRIDRRRVDSNTARTGDGFPPMVYYAAGLALILLFVGGAGYLITGDFGSEGQIHEHGTIELVIDGESVDWNQERFLYEGELRGEPFHFHQGDVEQNVWHMHPTRLTLSEAMALLGFELTSMTLVTAETTYDDDDPETTVSVTVNGELVDPTTYELHGVGPVSEAIQGAGDDVVISIETTAGNE